MRTWPPCNLPPPLVLSSLTGPSPAPEPLHPTVQVLGVTWDLLSPQPSFSTVRTVTWSRTCHQDTTWLMHSSRGGKLETDILAKSGWPERFSFKIMQCFQKFWMNYQHLKIRIFPVAIFLKVRQTSCLDLAPALSQGLSCSYRERSPGPPSPVRPSPVRHPPASYWPGPCGTVFVAMNWSDT